MATGMLPKPENPEFNLLENRRQQLTHQKILGSFWQVETSGSFQISEGFIWADVENLSKFAFPRMLSLFLEDNFLHLGKLKNKNSENDQ